MTQTELIARKAAALVGAYFVKRSEHSGRLSDAWAQPCSRDSAWGPSAALISCSQACKLASKMSKCKSWRSKHRARRPGDPPCRPGLAPAEPQPVTETLKEKTEGQQAWGLVPSPWSLHFPTCAVGRLAPVPLSRRHRPRTPRWSRISENLAHPSLCGSVPHGGSRKPVPPGTQAATWAAPAPHLLPASGSREVRDLSPRWRGPSGQQRVPSPERGLHAGAWGHSFHVCTMSPPPRAAQVPSPIGTAPLSLPQH